MVTPDLHNAVTRDIIETLKPYVVGGASLPQLLLIITSFLVATADGNGLDKEYLHRLIEFWATEGHKAMGEMQHIDVRVNRG